MVENLESISFVLAVIVIVIILPLMVLGRLRRARKIREQKLRQEQWTQFEHRQLNPNFAAFARHYGCEAPLPLRQLFEDRTSVLDENFHVILPSGEKYFVAWFEPMDEVEWPELEGLYSFANDGCGNPFLINPRESDPKVFFNDHETAERESLGVTLSQFLKLERTR